MKSEDKIGLLNFVEKAIWEHNPEALTKALESALKMGVGRNEMSQALFQGLERVRKKLFTPEVPLPKFLLSLEVLELGLKRLSGLEEREKTSGLSLVIGVVEGDPHDLGKNIISRVYSASGYLVYDLGTQVSVERFVNSVQEKQAKILALSTMISTTMIQIPEIIKRVKALAPDTVIMVGGAPLDINLAKSFGADGYAQSALTVLEETELAIERVSAQEKW